VGVEDDVYTPTSAKQSLAIMVGYRQELHVSDGLVVERRPRPTFTALVEGRCLNGPTLEAVAGVVGVEVKASFSDDSGSHMFVTRTDKDGRYALLTEWTRRDPSEEAPTGEDILVIDISFTDVVRGDDNLAFDLPSYTVRSWIRPNYVPDAIASVTDNDAG
jgi:hypothetical protein